MSARAAFIPHNPGASRPASRVANPMLKPDIHDVLKASGPLNISNLRKGGAGPAQSFPNDPASISNLSLPRRAPTSGQLQTNRPNGTETIQRSRTSLHIATPTPRNASPLNPVNAISTSISAGFKIPTMTTDGPDASHPDSLMLGLSVSSQPGGHRGPINTSCETEEASLTGDALRNRRRSKRTLGDLESSNNSLEMEYPPMKRFKNLDEDDEHKRSIDSHHQSQLQLQTSSSPASVHSIHSHYSHRSNHNEFMSNNHFSGSSLSYDNASMSSAEANNNASPFDRLFRHDLHSLEKFRQAEAKWSNCSIEEWKEGGKEVMDTYIRIMESVRERMCNKLDLYAEFDNRLSNHQGILKQREDHLATVRSNIVKGSGNVIVGAGNL